MINADIKPTGKIVCLFVGLVSCSTNRVFSRPVVLLVVTMETPGQTNQSSVATGSPSYLTI